MGEKDTTDRVAAIREQLAEKKSATTEHFNNFKTRTIAQEIDNDPSLRQLLTKLRESWREHHPQEPLASPVFVQKISPKEIS